MRWCCIARNVRARPERRQPPEPRQVERREPQPERRQQQQRASTAATQVQAPQGQRSAAPQQGNAPTAQQRANWQQQIQGQVARHMQRANIGRARGLTTTVNVTISGNGSVLGAQIAGSTGDAQLDAVLARQAQRLPRLPPPPSGQQTNMAIPVRIR